MVRFDTVWLATLGQLLLVDVSQMSVQVPSQVPPSSLRYCHLVIAEPPLPPEVQPKVTEASPPETVTLVGFGGEPTSVTEADSSDSAPSSTAFTARTLNLYVVPLFRLETVWLVLLGQLLSVDVSQMSVQVLSQSSPAFLRNCHLVICEPPSPPEAQPRVAEASPPVTVTLVGLGGLTATGVNLTVTVALFAHAAEQLLSW